MSAQVKRVPGEVLREARRTDSRAKRARVLAALDAMKADGTPVTFAANAKAAGVSTWRVYAQGVREHVEAAIKGQGAAGRRGRAAGAGASAASLATDLELVRAQNKALRAERDRLKAAVQHGLGDRLEATGSRELAERVGELLGIGAGSSRTARRGCSTGGVPRTGRPCAARSSGRGSPPRLVSVG